MRNLRRHFWFEIGVALAMLCLFPFYANGGGGPEQVAIPNIIVNPPAPEAHWLVTISVVVGISAALVTTAATITKWLKNRKETNGR
jgi:purine-cytosine permease-like protein